MLAWLALAGMVLADGGAARHALAAQDPSSGWQSYWPSGLADTVPPSWRLTVRPHQMTLGTRNGQAGQKVLDTYGDSVYVPPSAVGTKRVPLVVIFSEEVWPWRQMADQYGMILLTLSRDARADHSGVAVMDSALRQVLGTHAIDPDKIALMGLSGSGNRSTIIGCQNLDIFSHLGLLSQVPEVYPSCDDTPRPAAARTSMFISTGFEGYSLMPYVLHMAAQARRDGHPVQLVLAMRVHQSRRKDWGNVFQWLANDWTSPKTVTPPPPLKPELRLTPEILTKLTTFWTSFRKDYPVVIPWEMGEAEEWPAQNVKAVRIPVGIDTMTVYDLMDLPAIAARDSSIGASLQAAGLTWEQEENYRAALIGAYATRYARKGNASVREQSPNIKVLPDIKALPVLEQNLTLFEQHTAEVEALMHLITLLLQ